MYAVKHEGLRFLRSWCLSPEIVFTLPILDRRELPMAKVADDRYKNLGVDRRCFAWREEACCLFMHTRGEGLRETIYKDSIQFMEGDLIFYEFYELI